MLLHKFLCTLLPFLAKNLVVRLYLSSHIRFPFCSSIWSKKMRINVCSFGTDAALWHKVPDKHHCCPKLEQRRFHSEISSTSTTLSAKQVNAIMFLQNLLLTKAFALRTFARMDLHSRAVGNRQQNFNVVPNGFHFSVTLCCVFYYC